MNAGKVSVPCRRGEWLKSPYLVGIGFPIFLVVSCLVLRSHVPSERRVEAIPVVRLVANHPPIQDTGEKSSVTVRGSGRPFNRGLQVEREVPLRPFGVIVAGPGINTVIPTAVPFGSPQEVRRAGHVAGLGDDQPSSRVSVDPIWSEAGVDLSDAGMPVREIRGVDGFRPNPGREPRWRDERQVPWESLGYGEYIGPPRTPHLPEYKILILDQIDFVFRRTRQLSGNAYRFDIGDVLGISSEQYEAFNDLEQTIQTDGTIQVRGIGSVVAANKTVAELQDEINRLAQDPIRGTKGNPEILVKPINTETRLQDLIRTVDATAGFGGLSRTVTVAPDGTVQLPGINSVPALGLSLTEVSAEANARYAREVPGLEVTAILNARAPRFVYVLGEVVTPGQVELAGPTTVIQAISQVQGWRPGANLRHVVVMRRDKNWQLVATRLDLSGPLWGHRPNPSDDLWLRHSDIVIVPKNAGQRLADFIEVYFTRGLYGVFPTQGFAVGFNGVSRL
jgi:polysaccharide biosynthesis/export protein